MKGRLYLPVIFIVCILAAGCGGSGSASGDASGDDTVSVTMNSVTATFADSAQDVTITAYTNTLGGTTVYLGAPGLTLNISFDPPVSAAFPVFVAGSVSYVIGGIPYQNSSVPLAVTRSDPSMGGRVEGAFSDVVLTAGGGLPGITVSASFSATRIN
jgi:hypothetical protein